MWKISEYCDKFAVSENSTTEYTFISIFAYVL